MECLVTVMLLVFGLSLHSCSQFPQREYHYIEQPRSWSDAQKYCREKYSDLATIQSMEDIERLSPDFSYTYAWTGMHDDPLSWKENMGKESNSWRWSATGETSKTGYSKWAVGEPTNSNAKEGCVGMQSGGQWGDYSCEKTLNFICYTAANKTYAFISSQKTWAEAQKYCREHHTDLPMVESDGENTQVHSAVQGAVVWIGLYRVPWAWSDRTQSSFKNWAAGQPENWGVSFESCVAEDEAHHWGDHLCSSKYPFICHQEVKLRSVLKLNFQTEADMTDPAVSAQVLQQLEAEFRRQGWTDFKLGWSIQPKQQEEEETLPHPQCPLYV